MMTDQSFEEIVRGFTAVSNGISGMRTQGTNGGNYSQVNFKCPPSSHAKRTVRFIKQDELDEMLGVLKTLARAARSGDSAALDELRTKLDAAPYLCTLVADLQRQLELGIAQAVSPDDPLLREAFLRRASEIRDQLVGRSSSLLVQMAVSRVVACWLFAQFLALRAVAKTEDEARISRLEHAEKCMTSAMRTLKIAKDIERLERAGEAGPGRE